MKKLNLRKTEGKMTLFMILTSLLIIVGVFAIGFTLWAVGEFGHLDFEQYIFIILGPTAGTPMKTYIKVAITVGVILLIIVALILISYYFVRYEKNNRLKGGLSIGAKKTIVSFLAVALVVGSVYFTNDNLKILAHITKESSGFIEDHYYEPDETAVVFPEKKKNLVYIFLESFESTYYSKELGGNADTNLLPELTKLLEETNAVSFSHNDKNGGLKQIYGSTNSIAGMFAQQAGLPFKVPGDPNEYGVENNFIPGAVVLGDVLKREGYNLQFTAGTNGDFAGVNNFYTTHGDFELLDHTKALSEGLIPQGYNLWWGYEDKKLYEFSKDLIDEMAKDDNPFAIVIETTDTHFPDGYTDPSCEATSKQPYENSIMCTDKMVSEFIRYIQSQAYGDDTLIVLTGDHLSMEKEYFKTLDQNYERTAFNAFINVDPKIAEQARTTNRDATAIDIFPTILRGLNANLRAPRIGLGTDLFSNENTLAEEYGVDDLDKELSKKSPYFMDKFLLKRSDDDF